jgi:hypothetical protein
MRANPNITLHGDHNECPGCGLLFNSTRAFDRHRRAGRCLNQEEMQAVGMNKNTTGWWVTELRK